MRAYFLWLSKLITLIVVFLVLVPMAFVIAIGAIIAGRVFSLPHASKVGVISVVVVFACAIAYLVLPGMLNGILGKGCIG